MLTYRVLQLRYPVIHQITHLPNTELPVPQCGWIYVFDGAVCE